MPPPRSLLGLLALLYLDSCSVIMVWIETASKSLVKDAKKIKRLKSIKLFLNAIQGVYLILLSGLIVLGMGGQVTTLSMPFCMILVGFTVYSKRQILGMLKNANALSKQQSSSSGEPGQNKFQKVTDQISRAANTMAFFLVSLIGFGLIYSYAFIMGWRNNARFQGLSLCTFLTLILDVCLLGSQSILLVYSHGMSANLIGGAARRGSSVSPSQQSSASS